MSVYTFVLKERPFHDSRVITGFDPLETFRTASHDDRFAGKRTIRSPVRSGGNDLRLKARETVMHGYRSGFPRAGLRKLVR